MVLKSCFVGWPVGVIGYGGETSQAHKNGRRGC